MSRLSLILLIVVFNVVTAPIAWCETNDSAETSTKNSMPPSAEAVDPIEVGTVVPTAAVRTVEGSATDFHSVVKDKPTVLIFYRGGWCPYCNTHLGELATIESTLAAQGYQIVAVSPDRPEKLKESLEKNKVSYTLLSDSKMELAKAFGLAFKLDEQTVKKYRDEYSIDIEADSGETHHLLPVPAAFVIDSFGKIRYRFYSPDYKTRVKTSELLKAAEEAVN